MKPRHAGALALAALLVTLTGCYSVGAQVNEGQLAGFEKGRTTYSEIVAQLGLPTSQSVNSEGGRTASWLYAEVKSRPESFIPLIGPFIGGADMKSNMVTMRFDGQGVLQGFSSSSSQLGSGSGFASGVGAGGRIPDQPRQAGVAEPTSKVANANAAASSSAALQPPVSPNTIVNPNAPTNQPPSFENF